MPHIASSVKKQVTTTQCFRFFDQTVEICTDHEETLGLMDAMFRRLRINSHASTKTPICYEILKTASSRSPAMIRTQNASYYVAHLALLPAIAHGLILGEILAKVRSHLLFHAATLSLNGRGIVLVADSGCGKTTTSMALVCQGFKLLSDEIAAFNLESSLLNPYPRCLWVRTGTVQVFKALGWALPDYTVAKKVIEKEAIHLSESLLGASCHPDLLVFIKDPLNSASRICRVTLHNITNGLIDDLQNLIKSANKPKKSNGLFPVLEIETAHLPKLHNICDKHGILVLNVEPERVDPKYYQRTPNIVKISKINASIELLRAFHGTHRSVQIDEEANGSPAKLLCPITKLLAHTECYQMTPGKLDKMTAIINGLF